MKNKTFKNLFLALEVKNIDFYKQKKKKKRS